MTKIKYIMITGISILLTFTSCLEDDYKLGELIAPSNVELTQYAIQNKLIEI